jgi:PleD family two-component response regulator/cellulose synthase/poly-beta-1,6-N-acetylglucosamine synthase-like glycosyltransferase
MTDTQARPTLASAATSVTARVLVVDDDPALRLLVSTAVQQAGHQAHQAADGLIALSMLATGRYDAVITDVSMPHLDGIELLHRLRRDSDTVGLPVILLTSHDAPEDVVRGLRAGADDYVSKPVELSELIARLEARINRPPVPAVDLTPARNIGVVTGARFDRELSRELARGSRSGRLPTVAMVEVAEQRTLVERLGPQAGVDILRQVASMLSSSLDQVDLVGLVTNPLTGRPALAVLLPEAAAGDVSHRLHTVADEVAGRTLDVDGEAVHVTTVSGWLRLDQLAPESRDGAEALHNAAVAVARAHTQLDLVPVRWHPRMAEPPVEANRPKVLRTVLQILSTYVAGTVVPFFVYFGLYLGGIDITWEMYSIVLFALLVMAVIIWRECFFALDPRRPPDEPATPYPPATALISAYLPNEAATILETIRQYLALDYPGGLQVILAYNTPVAHPVEQVLVDLARTDPRFLPFRVEHSTSKAQNVNAALEVVTGEFVGMFDADHHPAPHAFQRAWRWISSGVDMVQGHCVVRNGDATVVSRTVAVEFEAIYAVSHPGRLRAHDFGIFGGSNGYWRTTALRETRMQAGMLTEDIDSTIRALYAGRKLVSDPALISYELAPTTMRALWRQRLRWAQGWFQVSRRHVSGVTNSDLSLKQRYGLSILLGWREIYPWISLQMFPVIAVMAIKSGGVWRLDWFIPLFLATSAFTMSAGPAQTLFAYRLAAPSIRPRKRWFWWYLLVATVFYTEFKNAVARVAQVKELAGERFWHVTPRQESESSQQRSMQGAAAVEPA